ncbi:Gfo/Idh/MocA family protein [Ferdinandcohnia sp. SAFN-114]|uniref:Gfo/Idh/MocA family protein n=1 Tax=Ferdinandcohnia sp. SAFN-114 TaxID=3387275 RepID=UPI003F7D5097
MTVGLAVIGVGEFGISHAKILSQMGQVELVYICDQSLVRAQRVAEEYGAENFTNHIEDVLSCERVDGVIIATSEESHYPLTIQSLQASKHVLIEKPISLDAEKALDMVKEAEKQKVILLPGHLLRYDASYNTIKQRLTSGELGDIYSIYARRNVPKERFGLHSRTHPVFMALAHDIDIVLWYVQSSVKRVYAVEKRTSEEYKNPDIFWGIVEFSNGVVATFETQWTLPNHLGQYLDVRLEMMTSEGKVSLQYPGDNLHIAVQNKTEIPDVTLWPEIFGTSTGALRNELDYFVSIIEKNEKPTSIRGEEAVQGIELAQLLIKSAQTRNPIEL